MVPIGQELRSYPYGRRLLNRDSHLRSSNPGRAHLNRGHSFCRILNELTENELRRTDPFHVQAARLLA